METHCPDVCNITKHSKPNRQPKNNSLAVILKNLSAITNINQSLINCSACVQNSSVSSKANQTLSKSTDSIFDHKNNISLTLIEGGYTWYQFAFTIKATQGSTEEYFPLSARVLYLDNQHQGDRHNFHFHDDGQNPPPYETALVLTDHTSFIDTVFELLIKHKLHHNIKEISLRDNGMKRLPKNVAEFKNLTILRLDSNFISNLNEVKELNKLKYLYLKNNELSNISALVPLIENGELRYVDLSYNQLAIVPEQLIDRVNYNPVINFNGNPLCYQSDINCRTSPAPPSPWQPPGLPAISPPPSLLPNTYSNNQTLLSNNTLIGNYENKLFNPSQMLMVSGIGIGICVLSFSLYRLWLMRNQLFSTRLPMRTSEVEVTSTSTPQQSALIQILEGYNIQPSEDQKKHLENELRKTDNFNCSLTVDRFEEPIALEDGSSYSSSKLTDWQNRLRDSGSTRSPQTRIQLALPLKKRPNHTFNELLKHSDPLYNWDINLLWKLCHCPLSAEFMTDPVIAADGYSYQRKAISDYLDDPSITAVSPVTKDPLNDKNLWNNITLKWFFSTLNQLQ